MTPDARTVRRGDSSAPTAADVGPGSDDVAAARRRLRPWRWLLGAVPILIGLWLVAFLVTNPRFEWDVVARYLFEPSVLAGLRTTVLLAVLAMAIGSVVGGVLAAAMVGGFAPARWAALVYVGVFRGIPPLVQLIFWFNLGYLIPRLSVGVPFGPDLASWDTNTVITPLVAGVVGLSLVESAYLAEIIRAGVLGVDAGQADAARAMGFTPAQTFFRITLPQAMRVIIPPAGSQFISVLKGTALVSVIAMSDLLHAVQVIYNQNYRIVPLLLVACFWYLLVVTLLTAGQRRLEARFARGHTRTAAVARDTTVDEAEHGSPTPTGPGRPTAPRRPPVDPAATPVLRLRGVRKRFGNHEALRGVDLDVHEGEVIAVIGPSGSGKSTLVRCVHQLESIDGGAMYLDGELLGVERRGDALHLLPPRRIATQRRRMGMVFQQFHLFPHFTALRNITEAPVRVHRTARAEAERDARTLLARVGLTDRAGHYPRQLSGGQQQRVAIARALATRPRILLLDEPTSALDPELVDEVLGVIRELAARHTMIVVTHEMAFAREVADRLVFMDDGVIVEQGPPADVLDRPAGPRLRAFLARYAARKESS